MANDTETATPGEGEQMDIVTEVVKLSIGDAANALEKAQAEDKLAGEMLVQAEAKKKRTAEDLRAAQKALDDAYRALKPKRKSPERKPATDTAESKPAQTGSRRKK